MFLVATAVPAWAHATLNSTDPPKDGVAAAVSDRAVADVQRERRGLVRRDPRLHVRGQAHHHGLAAPLAATSDHTVVVSVPKLDPGVYLVAWRVISADSHPVGGTYSFRVGPGAPPSVNGCATETNAKSSKTVGVLFGVARAGVFAGLALLIGGVVFLLLIASGSSAARSTRRAIWVGWIILAISTVAAVMLQGPYAAGSGIGDAVKWSVVHDVLQTRFGHVTEVTAAAARRRAGAVALPRALRPGSPGADLVDRARRRSSRSGSRARPGTRATPRPATSRSSRCRSTRSTCWR